MKINLVIVNANNGNRSKLGIQYRSNFSSLSCHTYNDICRQIFKYREQLIIYGQQIKYSILHCRLVRLGYLAFTQATRVQIPAMEIICSCVFIPHCDYFFYFYILLPFSTQTLYSRKLESQHSKFIYVNTFINVMDIHEWQNVVVVNGDIYV